jgi:hypothetical protein
MNFRSIKRSTPHLPWLNERLQAAFEAHGRVPQDTLDNLNYLIP